MMSDVVETPNRAGEVNWQEIASKGYSVQPFAGPAELDALKELYTAAIPEVPSDFFVSILLKSTETKRMILGGIRSILGEKLTEFAPGFQIVTASFVTKKAGSVHGLVGLHQDCSFVDHGKHLGINCWLPLSDVDAGNGCLKMVDYSQQFDFISFLPPSYKSYSHLEGELAPPYLNDIPMRAGEACTFDSRVIHASAQNHTGRSRVAAFFSLIPDGLPIRLNLRNPRYPDWLEVYHVDSEFMLDFDPLVYPTCSRRGEMKLVDSFKYTTRQLSMADFAALHPDVRWTPQPGPDTPSVWARLKQVFRD